MADTALVRTEDLSCGYRRDRPVLAGVTLAVPRNKTVVLLGPSGCGKTTLLKTVLGLVPPLAGRVTVLGQVRPAPPVRGAVGYVPQNLGLVRHTSVLRNVLLGALAETSRGRRLAGAFSAAHVRRALDALELVALAHKAEDRPIHLSGGERRRVAVARALLQRPALLVADEILSELDDHTAEIVLDAVRTLQKETGMGVLMVEHSVERSYEVADVLCWLGRGSLLSTITAGPDGTLPGSEAMARRAPTLP